MPGQLRRQLPQHRTFAALAPHDQRAYLVNFLNSFIALLETAGRRPTPWEQYCFDRTVHFMQRGNLPVALNEIVLLLSAPLDHLLGPVRDSADLRAALKVLETDDAVPVPETRLVARTGRR